MLAGCNCYEALLNAGQAPTEFRLKEFDKALTLFAPNFWRLARRGCWAGLNSHESSLKLGGATEFLAAEFDKALTLFAPSFEVDAARNGYEAVARFK